MGESIRGDKSICLPVESGTQYRDILFNPKAFRPYIIQIQSQYPELFPDSMEQGFWFHDFVLSTKQQLPTRRIKLKDNGEVDQLRPDFVMPYMVGKTDEIEKPIHLRQFGVPFEALAYVFGGNPMYYKINKYWEGIEKASEKRSRLHPYN